MIAKFTGTITNQANNESESCSILLQNDNGIYSASIGSSNESEQKVYQVTIDDGTIKDAIGKLLDYVNSKGYFIEHIKGYKELESNELLNYMFNYLSNDFGIVLNELYRNRISP